MAAPTSSWTPAVPGDVLFARYAFPPNELGYCGPEEPGVLLRHAVQGGAPSADIRRRAEQFEGAWVYLEAIAAAAGIADPLDARVVEAYWVGNDLLDAVDPAALNELLARRLAAQLFGPTRDRWARRPAATALAHHSFHVLAVYPWVALLPARSEVALSVLEKCGIRWGTVVGLDGDRARVLSRPLHWDGRRLLRAAERVESVRWAVDGLRPPPPVPGEVVACHWDWVCDRLDADQEAQLAARTQQQVDAVNTW